MEKMESQKVKDKKVPVEKSIKQGSQSSISQLVLWGVIVVLFGLSATLFWLNQQQSLSTDILIKRLNDVEQNTDIVQLKQSLSSHSQSNIDTLKKLNSVDIDLAEKIEQLAKMQQLTSDDVKYSWGLAEVKSLLQLANQSTLLMHNVENAYQALSIADKQLRELSDPRLFKLRSLIADEKIALNSVAKIDIEGLSIQLQGVIDIVDDLRILTGPESRTEKTEAPEVSQQWYSILMSVWQQIRSLVVIRHQQDGAEAVLVPEQRYFLYQNLRLKLETAQTALLLGESVVFYASLTSTERWLEDYFIDEKRDAVLAVVRHLQTVKINQNLPDISGSLVWLQKFGDQ